MTNSWDAYYDAFKTIFKDEDGDEATFDEEHSLDIDLLIEHEDKLIALGYKKKDSEDGEYSMYDLDNGEYYKFEEYGHLSLSFGLPSTFYDIDDFEEKAHKLLGFKKEWIKELACNG